MSSVMEKSVRSSKPPMRLHHNAYVVKDQERTRAFYEDVLGMPLVAFWIETEEFQGDYIVLSHAFYALQDGSALAFFSMADPAMQDKFKSPATQVFNHIAVLVDAKMQDTLQQRLEQAGYHTFAIEHGYCRSLYVMDPDGLRLEFTADDSRVDEINEEMKRSAHDWLKRWMAGHRETNNNWRHD